MARATASCEVCSRWKLKGKHKLFLWVPVGPDAGVYEKAWVHFACWKRLLAGERPSGLRKVEVPID